MQDLRNVCMHTREPAHRHFPTQVNPEIPYATYQIQSHIPDKYPVSDHFPVGNLPYLLQFLYTDYAHPDYT